MFGLSTRHSSDFARSSFGSTSSLDCFRSRAAAAAEARGPPTLWSACSRLLLWWREFFGLMCGYPASRHPYVGEARRGLAMALWDRMERMDCYTDDDGASLADMFGAQSQHELERVFGTDHSDALGWGKHLPTQGGPHGLDMQVRQASAVVLQRETLAAKRRVLGPQHPDTLSSASRLANTLREQYTWATKRRVLGAEHQDSIATAISLASTLEAAGKYAEAIDLHREVTNTMQRTLGAEHVDTLASANCLAKALAANGQRTEATRLHEEIMAIQHRVTSCAEAAPQQQQPAAGGKKAASRDAQVQHPQPPPQAHSAQQNPSGRRRGRGGGGSGGSGTSSNGTPTAKEPVSASSKLAAALSAPPAEQARQKAEGGGGGNSGQQIQRQKVAVEEQARVVAQAPPQAAAAMKRRDVATATPGVANGGERHGPQTLVNNSAKQLGNQKQRAKSRDTPRVAEVETQRQLAGLASTGPAQMTTPVPGMAVGCDNPPTSATAVNGQIMASAAAKATLIAEAARLPSTNGKPANSLSINLYDVGSDELVFEGVDVVEQREPSRRPGASASSKLAAALSAPGDRATEGAVVQRRGDGGLSLRRRATAGRVPRRANFRD
mmetsp:Transcript_81924/g.228330  ORF Transcript_81924/g.228330 Transcript_81924/m.228330 type:complete len:610 (+) Transcript_81924:157-1986(+)